MLSLEVMTYRVFLTLFCTFKAPGDLLAQDVWVGPEVLHSREVPGEAYVASPGYTSESWATPRMERVPGKPWNYFYLRSRSMAQGEDAC